MSSKREADSWCFKLIKYTQPVHTIINNNIMYVKIIIGKTRKSLKSPGGKFVLHSFQVDRIRKAISIAAHTKKTTNCRSEFQQVKWNRYDIMSVLELRLTQIRGTLLPPIDNTHEVNYLKFIFRRSIHLYIAARTQCVVELIICWV